LSAARKHQLFAAARQRPVSKRRAPDAEYSRPASIPPTVIVRYIKQRFVRNVYQAAALARGDPKQLPILLDVTLLHYAGDHSKCQALFPGGCKPTLTAFDSDGPYLSFLRELYREFFGEAGSIMMGSVAMVLVLHTNACEAFHSRVHSYVPKSVSFRSRWYDGPIKMFLDMASGDRAWRESCLAKSELKLSEAQLAVYGHKEVSRDQAAMRVRTGMDARTKARAKSLRSDRTAAAKAPATYLSKSSHMTRKEVRMDTLSQFDPTQHIEQQARHDVQFAISDPNAAARHAMQVSKSGSSLHKRGQKRGRPVASACAPAPAAQTEVKSSSEDEISGSDTSDTDRGGGSLQLSSDGDSDMFLPVPGQELTYAEGKAQGWRRGNIRFIDDYEGKPYFLREAFVNDMWVQFYFEQLSGLMDTHSGQPQVTAAIWPTQDLEDDTSKPDGSLVHSSTDLGFAKANSVL
jgi:hypothetical protein